MSSLLFLSERFVSVIKPLDLSKHLFILLIIIVCIPPKTKSSLNEARNYKNSYEVTQCEIIDHPRRRTLFDLNALPDLDEDDAGENESQRLIADQNNVSKGGRDMGQIHHGNKVIEDDGSSSNQEPFHIPQLFPQNIVAQTFSQFSDGGVYPENVPPSPSDEEPNRSPKRTKFHQPELDKILENNQGKKGLYPHGPPSQSTIDLDSQPSMSKALTLYHSGQVRPATSDTDSLICKVKPCLHQDGGQISSGDDSNKDSLGIVKHISFKNTAFKKKRQMKKLKDLLGFGQSESEAPSEADHFVVDQNQRMLGKNITPPEYLFSPTYPIWLNLRKRSSLSGHKRFSPQTREKIMKENGDLPLEVLNPDPIQSSQKESGKSIPAVESESEFTSRITVVKKKNAPPRQVTLKREGKTLIVTCRSEVIRVKLMERFAVKRFDFEDEYSTYKSSMNVIPTSPNILSKLLEKLPLTCKWIVEGPMDQDANSKGAKRRFLTFERIHENQDDSIPMSPQYHTHKIYFEEKLDWLPHQKLMREIIESREYDNLSPSEEFILTSAADSTPEQAYMLCLINSYVHWLGSGSKEGFPNWKIFEAFQERRDKTSKQNFINITHISSYLDILSSVC